MLPTQESGLVVGSWKQTFTSVGGKGGVKLYLGIIRFIKSHDQKKVYLKLSLLMGLKLKNDILKKCTTSTSRIHFIPIIQMNNSNKRLQPEIDLASTDHVNNTYFLIIKYNTHKVLHYNTLLRFNSPSPSTSSGRPSTKNCTYMHNCAVFSLFDSQVPTTSPLPFLSYPKGCWNRCKWFSLLLIVMLQCTFHFSYRWSDELLPLNIDQYISKDS